MSLTRKHFNKGADIASGYNNPHDRIVARNALAELFRWFGDRFDAGRFYEAVKVGSVSNADIDDIEDWLGSAETASLAMDDPTDRRRMAEWIAARFLS